MTQVLAVDAGTSAVKVALVADGRVVAAAEEPYPLHGDRPGWAEQDPDDWWTATVRAAGRLDENGRRGVDVVAVTGQMQDLVAVDGNGRPVRRAILYSDVRAAPQCEQLAAELGDAWGRAIGATPDASHVAPKWRWLTEHEPDAVARTARVLFGAAGDVVARLTGRACCDPSTAATTGLYDVDGRRWWPPVVEALAIPVPELTAPTAVVGGVTDAAAAALGVRPGVPVVHANGDAAATTIGVCGLELDRPYAYLGTSGWAAVATAAVRRAPGVIVLPGLGPDHWIAAAQMSVAGAAVDWARDHLLGGATHAELELLAAGRCAAAEGVLFVPALDGARGAPAATGVLVGVRRTTTTATIAAAVVEGLAHAVRQLVRSVHPDATELAVCGGAARSAALRQAIADVTGCVVTTVAWEHASVLGAATAAQLAVGDDPPPPAAMSAPVRPDERRRAIHDQIGSIFDAVLPTMAPLLAPLAEVRSADRSTGG